MSDGAIGDVMVTVHDQAGAHRARQGIKCGVAGGMAARCLVRHQDVGALGCKVIIVLRPDRGGAE